MSTRNVINTTTKSNLVKCINCTNYISPITILHCPLSLLSPLSPLSTTLYSVRIHYRRNKIQVHLLLCNPIKQSMDTKINDRYENKLINPTLNTFLNILELLLLVPELFFLHSEPKWYISIHRHVTDF